MKVVTVASFPASSSGIASFEANYRNGVANALSIDPMYVTITSVTVVARRDMRRVLLSVTVNVAYVVSVPAAASAVALTATLVTAQSSGALDSSLQTSGIVGALTSQADVVNLSPTSSPTFAPNFAPTFGPTFGPTFRHRNSGCIVMGYRTFLLSIAISVISTLILI